MHGFIDFFKGVILGSGLLSREKPLYDCEETIDVHFIETWHTIRETGLRWWIFPTLYSIYEMMYFT